MQDCNNLQVAGTKKNTQHTKAQHIAHTQGILPLSVWSGTVTTHTYPFSSFKHVLAFPFL